VACGEGKAVEGDARGTNMTIKSSPHHGAYHQTWQ